MASLLSSTTSSTAQLADLPDPDAEAATPDAQRARRRPRAEATPTPTPIPAAVPRSLPTPTPTTTPKETQVRDAGTDAGRDLTDELDDELLPDGRSRGPRRPVLPADACAEHRRSSSSCCEPLTELGLPLEQVLVEGMGRFPVAGLAYYFDDWLNPRFTPKPHLHHGLDIFADFGTPIRAPDSGRRHAVCRTRRRRHRPCGCAAATEPPTTSRTCSSGPRDPRRSARRGRDRPRVRR